MKSASQFLKNYLNTGQEFLIAELYTFTLADGTVLRYATGSADIRLPANLITNSQQLELFGTGGASVSANLAAAPDGTTTAESLIEDGTIGAVHFCASPNVVIPAVAGSYTGSVYLKAGSRHWAALQLQEETGFTSITAYFDLTAGVIGATILNGASWTTCLPRIVNAGNGWWRCSVSGTKTNAATALKLAIYLATANNGATYNGNNSGNVFLWGAAIDSVAYATAYAATDATAAATRTFDSKTLTFVRGSVKTTIGVQVATLDLVVTADVSHLIAGTPWLQAVRQGSLDGATVLLERLFMPTLGDYSLGTFIVFSGRVADISMGRFEAGITVNSDMELLNIPMPRNVYQPGCLNTLFDSSCTLSKAAFGIAGTIVAGTTVALLYTDLSQPIGWFASGTITFTSGALNGVSAGVKDYGVVGRVSLYQPLNAVPAVGDTFTIYPGCPKTQSACSNVAATAPAFNNLIHFRGFPYVPAPETVT